MTATPKRGRPVGSTKDEAEAVQRSIRLPEELDAAIVRYAAQDALSVPAWIRSQLARAVRRRQRRENGGEA